MCETIDFDLGSSFDFGDFIYDDAFKLNEDDDDAADSADVDHLTKLFFGAADCQDGGGARARSYSGDFSVTQESVPEKRPALPDHAAALLFKQSSSVAVPSKKGKGMHVNFKKPSSKRAPKPKKPATWQVEEANDSIVNADECDLFKKLEEMGHQRMTRGCDSYASFYVPEWHSPQKLHELAKAKAHRKHRRAILRWKAENRSPGHVSHYQQRSDDAKKRTRKGGKFEPIHHGIWRPITDFQAE